MNTNWKIATFTPQDIIAGSANRSLDDFGWSPDSPPSPLAFAGAIRTSILNSIGYNFKSSNSNSAESKSIARQLGVPAPGTNRVCLEAMDFCVFGPFYFEELQTELSKDINLFFRSPRHLLVQDPEINLASSAIRILAAPSLKKEGVLFDEAFESAFPLDTKEPAYDYSDQLFASHPLVQALLGSPSAIPAKPIYETEQHVGHQRNARGTPENEALFTRNVRRFYEGPDPDFDKKMLLSSGYAVLLKTPNIPNVCSKIPVRLGSDGHQAIMKLHDASTLMKKFEDLKTSVCDHIAATENAKVVIYLASPAVFSEGWKIPLENSGFQFISAAIDKPKVIAGWDMARRRPKPPRRCVPEGSVYFLTVHDREKALRFVEEKHFSNPLTDEYSGLGLGGCLFGLWN